MIRRPSFPTIETEDDLPRFLLPREMLPARTWPRTGATTRAAESAKLPVVFWARRSVVRPYIAIFREGKLTHADAQLVYQVMDQDDAVLLWNWLPLTDALIKDANREFRKL